METKYCPICERTMTGDKIHGALRMIISVVFGCCMIAALAGVVMNQQDGVVKSFFIIYGLPGAFICAMSYIFVIAVEDVHAIRNHIEAYIDSDSDTDEEVASDEDDTQEVEAN